MQKKINNDKLTIKNLPLSVSNEEIEKLLIEKKVKLVSPVRYGLIRDESGQATTYKSGDRYVYVESFDTPLPVQQHIGTFQCLILHHGKTMPPCKSCNRSGHKVGDERCPAKPSDTILAFRGYGHPLSNHYACDITVNGTTFKSVEHAYFHRMATEMGKHDLADDIKNARHAGAAKRLGHDVASDEDRWAWELDNIEVMEKLLQAKLKQCPTFKQCLIESTGMIIAEATNSKIWATGMTPYVTERTSKEYWPGRNLLGAMLTEMSQELAEKQPMECTRESGELVSDDPSPNDVTLAQHPRIQYISQTLNQNCQLVKSLCAVEPLKPVSLTLSPKTVNPPIRKINKTK